MPSPVPFCVTSVTVLHSVISVIDAAWPSVEGNPTRSAVLRLNAKWADALHSGEVLDSSHVLVHSKRSRVFAAALLTVWLVYPSTPVSFCLKTKE